MTLSDWPSKTTSLFIEDNRVRNSVDQSSRWLTTPGERSASQGDSSSDLKQMSQGLHFNAYMNGNNRMVASLDSVESWTTNEQRVVPDQPRQHLPFECRHISETTNYRDPDGDVDDDNKTSVGRDDVITDRFMNTKQSSVTIATERAAHSKTLTPSWYFEQAQELRAVDSGLSITSGQLAVESCNGFEMKSTLDVRREDHLDRHVTNMAAGHGTRTPQTTGNRRALPESTNFRSNVIVDGRDNECSERQMAPYNDRLYSKFVFILQLLIVFLSCLFQCYTLYETKAC